jgi:hypothetical protein
VKLESEIEKCKKARGPNVKKMKERTTLLGAKVDHARVTKGKISDVHTALLKGSADGHLVRNLKLHLADFIANTDDQPPAYLKQNLDTEVGKVLDRINEANEQKQIHP